jgi:hypothetical protein
MLYRCVSIAVAVGLVSLTGCRPGKLDETRTLSLGGDVVAQGLDLPAQSKPQTINIEFSSSAGEVSVYLFKEDDAKGEDGLTSANPTKAIAKKTNSKGDSFSAEVPPNTSTRVIIRGGGNKTDVTIKVTNQK